MPEPWEDYDPNGVYAGDHLYSGDREIIEDLILLTEVCLSFEHWADDFRYWDRYESTIPMSQWDSVSVFSESCSIQMSMASNREK